MVSPFFRKFLLLLFAVAHTSPAVAKATQGPAIAVEQAPEAKVEGGDKDTKPGDRSVARRRYELNLLIPVPAKVFGGLVVVKADIFEERRAYSGKDAAGTAVDVKNPNVAGTGLVFLPHVSEGAPKFFVVAERYGYLSTERRALAMGEYIIGADIADDDMPFHLKFSPTDEAASRVTVRLRRFPGFNKWLFLVAHKIDTKTGFSIDGGFPSHLIVGWQTSDDAWKVYGGGRLVSREYPLTPGWIEGFAGYGLLGLRRVVMGPVYATLEAGMQKEWTDWHDIKGRIMQRYETAWGPFVRLGVETWVSVP